MQRTKVYHEWALSLSRLFKSFDSYTYKCTQYTQRVCFFSSYMHVLYASYLPAADIPLTFFGSSEPEILIPESWSSNCYPNRSTLERVFSWFSYCLHLLVLGIPISCFWFAGVPRYSALECYDKEPKEVLMEQIRQFEARGLINKDPVCRGTSVGMSASPRYVSQYRSYKNCRVVVGNLELTYLNCPNLDYSFYQNITEITGASKNLNFVIMMKC